MNMNPHLIEDDEILISRSIYQMVDTIGVTGAIELLHTTTGNAATSAEVDLDFIGTTLANYAATGHGPPQLNEHPTRMTRGARTLRKVPPSDPAEFDAWIVALFLQNIDTSHQRPQWLYARRQAPRHVPPTDPAAFDAWVSSFFTRSEADRTRHRDAVRDEQRNNILLDTLSRGSSGLASTMADPSCLGNELPWWIVPPGLPSLIRIPCPVVATTVPGWLSNGEPSMIKVKVYLQASFNLCFRMKISIENSLSDVGKPEKSSEDVTSCDETEGVVAGSKLRCGGGGRRQESGRTEYGDFSSFWLGRAACVCCGELTALPTKGDIHVTWTGPAPERQLEQSTWRLSSACQAPRFLDSTSSLY
ncbi:hypothetical protein IW261DRAFT_1426578 [Armillaria novae-zelandiae]|uniref:Uncharacterized protein n=1 Tax=Armillaria novae-zelandiae TaxID=153914 RepID=A0AA39NKT0_9AGAR|nr:hypothetical protein IW261DRAFT_1426578 [Armillaria novae-zelandiae]